MTKIPLEIVFYDYPICTLSLVEAYLNYKKIEDDISNIFFEYSLFYKRNNDIMIKDKKLNLNIRIRENEKSMQEDYDENDIYLQELKKVYGVSLQPIEHIELRAFKEFINEQLMRNEPIIYQYDLFYIPSRMCYKQFHFEHMIAIIGYDENNRTYLCIDANESPYFEIGMEELEEAFSYIKGKYMTVRSYNVCKNSQTQKLSSQYLKERIKSIIDYNDVSNTDKGLNAYNNFSKDFVIALRSNTKHLPFDIQDIHKIYKERKTSARCLANFQDMLNVPNDECQELIKSLQSESALWFELSIILKKSLFQGIWLYDKEVLFLLKRIHKAMSKTIGNIIALYENIKIQ